jgi:hypothetical protein
LPGKKIEKQAGLAERPLPRAAAALEYFAEQLLGAVAMEEMLLIGRALVGVSGRHGYPIDTHRLDRVEEARDAIGLCRVE